MYSFLLDLIICFLQHIIIYRFCMVILHQRPLRWRRKIGTFFGCSFILALVNQVHNPLLNIIIFTATTLSMVCLIFAGKKLKLMGYAFFLILLECAIEFTALPAASLLIDLPIAVIGRNSEYQFMFSLVNQLVFFVLTQIALIIYTKVRHMKGAASTYLLLLPVIGVITGLVMLHLEAQIEQATDAQYMLIALSCLGHLLVCLIIFFEHNRSQERHEWEARYNTLEQYNEAQTELYERLREHLEEIRVERHDFKEKLTVIEHIVKDEPAELTEYIHSLSNIIDAKNIHIELSLDNPALNIILQEKAEICDALGIRFEYHFEYPNMSFLCAADTVAIFANALNNAIEACRGIQEAAIPKLINLHVWRIHDLIYICIRNNKANCIRRNEKGYVSSKSEPHKHGYGIISIERAAANYDGVVDVEYDENSFAITIRLCLNP